MRVKLLKTVLVGPADVIPAKHGTVVDIPDDQAKEFVNLGLAQEIKHDKPEAEKKKGK